MLDKLRGDVCRRIRHWRRESSLLPYLVERGKRAVAPYQYLLIFLLAALHSPNQNGRGEAGILQNPLPNQLGDHAR